MIKDIELQPDGDVKVLDDIFYTESTFQHKADILKASKGDYLNAPLVGVNTIDYLLDEQPQRLLQEVARQMAIDGIKVKKVYFEGRNLVIDGEYEDKN